MIPFLSSSEINGQSIGLRDLHHQFLAWLCSSLLGSSSVHRLRFTSTSSCQVFAHFHNLDVPAPFSSGISSGARRWWGDAIQSENINSGLAPTKSSKESDQFRSISKVSSKVILYLSALTDRGATMKVSLLAVPILLVLPSVHAGWLFQYGNPTSVDTGNGDQKCKSITNKAGTDFSWHRSFFSNCCIRLYRDSHCGQQDGISCPDWSKTASQNVFSYEVTDC